MCQSIGPVRCQSIGPVRCQSIGPVRYQSIGPVRCQSTGPVRCQWDLSSAALQADPDSFGSFHEGQVCWTASQSGVKCPIWM